MIFKILEKVGNNLDSLKEYDLANRVDSVLRRFANDPNAYPSEEEKIDEGINTDVWDLDKEEELLNNPDSQVEQDLLKQLAPISDYRDKRGFGFKPFNIKLLEKYDLYPITSGEETTPHLGTGAYGSVYNVICGPSSPCSAKGEVAVKISRDFISGSEGTVWKKIQEAAKDMPPNLTKHMPKIYNIIFDTVVEEDPMDRTETRTYPATLIIMEKLAPLNSDPKLKALLFEDYLPQNTIQDLIKNETLLFELLKEITNNFMNLDRLNVSKLFKHALNFKPDPTKRETRQIELFKYYLLYYLDNLEDQVRDLDPEIKNQISQVKYKIDKNLIPVLVRYVFAGDFPSESFSDKNPVFKHLPETKSLLTFLNALKEKGIDWHDLHHNNLMIRPSTGDLVIIDVGLYTF